MVFTHPVAIVLADRSPQVLTGHRLERVAARAHMLPFAQAPPATA